MAAIIAAIIDGLNKVVLSAGAEVLLLLQGTLGKVLGGVAMAGALLDGLRRAASTPKNAKGGEADEQARRTIKRKKKNFWVGALIVVAAIGVATYVFLELSGTMNPKRPPPPFEFWEAATAILAVAMVIGTILIDLRLRALDR